jgi:hypothetical protein
MWLKLDGTGPAFRQIYRALRTSIVSGARDRSVSVFIPWIPITSDRHGGSHPGTDEKPAKHHSTLVEHRPSDDAHTRSGGVVTRIGRPRPRRGVRSDAPAWIGSIDKEPTNLLLSTLTH